MKAIVIDDGRVVYTRVTKSQALKRFNDGKSVTLCPVNLRPGFPFAPHCRINPTLSGRQMAAYNHDGAGDMKDVFLQLVDEFTWYNCIDRETGRYPAFYVETYKE